MGHLEYRKYVRMTDGDLRELYRQLDDARVAESNAEEQRDGTRWPYQHKEITVLIAQPGGTRTGFIGVARNLSAGGIGVFHGGFVHPGSSCRVVLENLAGSDVLVEGNVVSCRHLQGTVHEIGIAFKHPINLVEYVAQAGEQQRQTA